MTIACRPAWTVLLVLLSLRMPAGAAPMDGGPFEAVRRGDRVRLILKSKSPVTGVVRAVEAERITLDLRWEEGGVEGTLSVDRDLVRSVQVMAAWDERELARRRESRMRRLQEAEEELSRAAAGREGSPPEADASRRGPDTKGPAASGRSPVATGKPASGALTPEEMEKGLALMKEFPPKEGWGTASDKTADWLKIKFPVIGAALTAAEQKFLDNYDLWLRTKQAVESGAPIAAPAPKPVGETATPATAPVEAPKAGPNPSPAPAAGSPPPPPPPGAPIR